MKRTASKKRKVLIGLSGGVDSSVAAAILKEEGFELTAVRMRVYEGPDDEKLAYGCYGRSSKEDENIAQAVAASLDIPFKIIECANPWQKHVLDYFRREYLEGKTPNPCIRCNELIKFGLLPKLAKDNGIEFDYYATGHYASIEKDPQGNWISLKRGVDTNKDQSYFLYRLKASQLEKTLLPLGCRTKKEVRAIAQAKGLINYQRPDSQDFYGGDYSELLNVPKRKGAIVDTSGKVLGYHEGFWHYTPGQRKGLGVCGPVPLYVLAINAKKNDVVVGPAEENSFSSCKINDINFLMPLAPEGSRLMAKMRSAQALKEVEIGKTDEKGQIEIKFIKAISGLAPGQSLVLYKGDLVMGGGIIVKS